MGALTRIGEHGLKFRFWNVFGITDLVWIEVKVYIQSREQNIVDLSLGEQAIEAALVQ